MWEPQLRLTVLITGFTIAAGVLDSFAFTYAASMWQGGRLVWSEAAKSAATFILGMTMYWGSVRYLSLAGIVMPEIQTLLWFGITIVGVAILGGRFLQWHVLDQIIALNVLLSIGWLISRAASSTSAIGN